MESKAMRLPWTIWARGYSGPEYHVDLNPTYLKIDMHIIRDIDKDNTKRAL